MLAAAAAVSFRGLRALEVRAAAVLETLEAATQ
jgi:hypothetical protein